MLLLHPLGHSAGPSYFYKISPILLHRIGAGSPVPQEIKAGAGNQYLTFPQELKSANFWPVPELGPTLI